MVKLIRKGKKKKGFTLIELVAVVAIIGILAAILVPKIAGYMTEAKKTKIIDQARKVVLAVETYNMKNDVKIDDTWDLNKEGGNKILAKKSVCEFIDPSKNAAALLGTDGALNKLNADMTLAQCRAIVENRQDFTLTDTEGFEALIPTT